MRTVILLSLAYFQLIGPISPNYINAAEYSLKNLEYDEGNGTCDKYNELYQ